MQYSQLQNYRNYVNTLKIKIAYRQKQYVEAKHSNNSSIQTNKGPNKQRQNYKANKNLLFKDPAQCREV